MTVVFFSARAQLTDNTSTLLLKECRPSANGEWARDDASNCIFLSSLTGTGKLGRASIRGALVAKFHQSGGYRPRAEWDLAAREVERLDAALGGWPTFALPRLWLPQPSRFSKAGNSGEGANRGAAPFGGRKAGPARPYGQSTLAPFTCRFQVRERRTKLASHGSARRR